MRYLEKASFLPFRHGATSMGVLRGVVGSDNPAAAADHRLQWGRRRPQGTLNAWVAYQLVTVTQVD